MIRTLCLLALAFASAAHADALERHPEAIRITDPARLAAIGFGPDAVVHELHEAQADPAAERESAGSGGTVFRSYLGVDAQGRTGAFEYSTVYSSGDIHRISAAESFADILVTVPAGYRFEFVRFWAEDNSAANDLQVFLLERCLPSFTAGVPELTVIGSAVTGGNPGYVTQTLNLTPDFALDTTACTYSLRLRFDTTDSSLSFFRARVQLVPQA